jgi:hypothetical protein
MISSYKVFGIDMGITDSYLTVVGSVGVLFNTFSRFIYGSLTDIYEFWKLYLSLLFIQAQVTSSIFWISTIESSNEAKEWLFMLFYCLSSICYGGHFSLAPMVCVKIYGSKK